MENYIILILFAGELFTLLYIIKYVLHISVTHSQIRKWFSLCITLLWSVCIVWCNPAIPYTFSIICVVFLLFHEKWYFLLCSIVVYTLVINIVSNILLYLYYVIIGSFNYLPNISFLSSVLTLICLFLSAYYLQKKIPKNIKPLRNLKWQGYVIITLVAFVDFILSAVSSVLFHYELNAPGRHLLVIAILIMIAMSIVLLSLYFRLQYYHTLLQQTDAIQKKMLQLEEQHYRELQQKNMDIRAFRHDYNYHITSMQALVEQNNLEALKKYISNLSNVKEQVYYWSTNHPVADAIINYFYENKPTNTTFLLDGKFPDNFFVEDSDLCIVLSNLLKNAVEEVHKLSDTANKTIYVSIFSNEQYATIYIENTSHPYLETDLKQLSTSKIDTFNHGFGLQNVRDVATKHDGKLDLKYCDGIFTASIYLRNI